MPVDAPATAAEAARKQRTPRLEGATLLRKSLDVDIFESPGCGGRRRVLAELKGAGVREVLRQLGLPAEALPLVPARGPPEEAWLQ
jgi:hypothetical protein